MLTKEQKFKWDIVLGFVLFFCFLTENYEIWCCIIQVSWQQLQISRPVVPCGRVKWALLLGRSSILLLMKLLRSLHVSDSRQAVDRWPGFDLCWCLYSTVIILELQRVWDSSFHVGDDLTSSKSLPKTHHFFQDHYLNLCTYLWRWCHVGHSVSVQSCLFISVQLWFLDKSGKCTPGLVNLRLSPQPHYKYLSRTTLAMCTYINQYLIKKGGKYFFISETVYLPFLLFAAKQKSQNCFQHSWEITRVDRLLLQTSLSPELSRNVHEGTYGKHMK